MDLEALVATMPFSLAASPSLVRTPGISLPRASASRTFDTMSWREGHCGVRLADARGKDARTSRYLNRIGTEVHVYTRRSLRDQRGHPGVA